MGYWGNLAGALMGVERLNDGTFRYKFWDFAARWVKASTDKAKVKAILENPAALYVFLLLPELFSMGKYKLYSVNGEDEIEKHPLLDFLRNPNPMQTGSQFKWDYMFHRKLGTANLYIDSMVPSNKNKMYFLFGDCIKWPEDLKKRSMDLVLSDTRVSEIKNALLTYKTDTQDFTFKYEKLLQFFDISNGINSWFSSPSRVDAIYKIIDNSEKTLKSKNVNADFASKFLVSGQVPVEQTSQLQMTAPDKASIRDSMRSDESVFPTKTKTAIERFISDSGIFEALDKSFMNDAFVLGKMLNIPKDVIEMLGEGATYENQEKARAMIISYCIQPDADDFCDGIMRYFNLHESLVLKIDYSHLPFVQALEKDRAETLRLKADAFMKLIDSGADPTECAQLLGLDLETFGPVNPNRGVTMMSNPGLKAV